VSTQAKSAIFFPLLLVLGCTTAPRNPKLGWARAGSETFSLNATEHKYFRLPPGRWQIQYSAETAVYGGLMTQQQYSIFQGQHPKYLELTDFSQFQCVSASINEEVTECDVQGTDSILAVRDKRGPITKLFGAYELLRAKGNGGFADRASRPNKVTVTTYKWDCIENCPSRPSSVP
jgi:hypothetical protein